MAYQYSADVNNLKLWPMPYNPIAQIPSARLYTKKSLLVSLLFVFLFEPFSSIFICLCHHCDHQSPFPIKTGSYAEKAIWELTKFNSWLSNWRSPLLSSYCLIPSPWIITRKRVVINLKGKMTRRKMTR